ncbi:hypothetical protein MLD38_030196 [Melastoma candidum]|uniref:Uncharacterized protein n=1 Tax=Melastoma candidum TaxID=119954 RepID=A0ACB9MMU2_9MYRT|nr:hypothetical protein MLD38_030196 [Melastoma candidum]
MMLVYESMPNKCLDDAVPGLILQFLTAHSSRSDGNFLNGAPGYAESLKPGERNLEAIDKAIHGYEVGVLIFSPNYGESLYCLDELVQLMETGKPLLPIFCDIEPSELRVGERQVQRSSVEQAKKWADALEEAKGITGLRFNSHAG